MNKNVIRCFENHFKDTTVSNNCDLNAKIIDSRPAAEHL